MKKTYNLCICEYKKKMWGWDSDAPVFVCEYELESIKKEGKSTDSQKCNSYCLEMFNFHALADESEVDNGVQ